MISIKNYPNLSLSLISNYLIKKKIKYYNKKFKWWWIFKNKKTSTILRMKKKIFFPTKNCNFYFNNIRIWTKMNYKIWTILLICWMCVNASNANATIANAPMHSTLIKIDLSSRTFTLPIKSTTFEFKMNKSILILINA